MVATKCWLFNPNLPLQFKQHCRLQQIHNHKSNTNICCRTSSLYYPITLNTISLACSIGFAWLVYSSMTLVLFPLEKFWCVFVLWTQRNASCADIEEWGCVVMTSPKYQTSGNRNRFPFPVLSDEQLSASLSIFIGESTDSHTPQVVHVC